MTVHFLAKVVAELVSRTVKVPVNDPFLEAFASSKLMMLPTTSTVMMLFDPLVVVPLTKNPCALLSMFVSINPLLPDADPFTGITQYVVSTCLRGAHAVSALVGLVVKCRLLAVGRSMRT
jgi:hypothetical protein